MNTNFNQTPNNNGTEIDWKEKFINSQKEAINLHHKLKEMEGLQNQYRNNGENVPEDLTDLIGNLRQQVEQESNKEIVSVKKELGEIKFNNAVSNVIGSLPQLSEYSAEFKEKLNGMNMDKVNIPDNIESIITELAKSFLFDKQTALGTPTNQGDPVQFNGGTNGESNVHLHHTIQEWGEIAKNPEKFAKLRKEYEEDEAKNFGL